MPSLHIGTLPGEAPFELDLDRFADEGARVGLFASSGAGKGYLLGVLLEELIAAGYPVVMVDPEDELWTFREAGAFVVGGRHGHVPLPAVLAELVPLAREVIAHCLATATPVVFDLDGLGGDEITHAFEFIAGEYWRQINETRRPSVLAITEAHLVAPQALPRGASPGVVLPRLLSGGRKRGAITLLETQRLAEIAKAVINHCNVRFIGRIDDADDYARVAKGMPRAVTFEEVSSLQRGTFYVPRLAGAEPVRVRERRVTHGSGTPAGGGELTVRPAAAAQERAIAQLAERLAAISPEPVPAGDPATGGSTSGERAREAAVPPAARGRRRRDATLEQPTDAAAPTTRREAHLDAEVARLQMALSGVRDDLESARMDVEQLQHENEEAYAQVAALERALEPWDAVALALTTALAGRGTVGGEGDAGAAAAGRPAGIDESRIIELIRRHAPGMSAPELVPIEALRARYLEAAAQRLVAVMRGLDPDEREALLFLLTRDAFITINAVAVGISGSDSVRERWSKALTGLAGRDLVVIGGSGRSGRRANVDAWVRSALAPHQPTDAEVTAVRDRALSVLMSEGGS
ncbi:MAG: DUF87 domain-containing protein [Dehalococcoidia bacterium]